MLLELKHFRLVHYVAREKSLTAASRFLHLSQPALSRQLSDLEDRLGLLLFHRHGREMTPTRACRKLLDTAQDVLAIVERQEEELRMIAAGEGGSIRLTTECYTCYRWLPGVLGRFRVGHPGVEVEIDTRSTSEPFEAIYSGDVDVAIASSEPPGSDFVSTPLFTDELVAIMHPDHRLAECDALAPEDFEGEDLILYSEAGSDLIRSVLHPNGITPGRVLELQITDGIVELVKAGLGISVVANWAVAADVDAGTIVTARIGHSGMTRSWKAVTATAAGDVGPIRSLIDLIAASRLVPASF